MKDAWSEFRRNWWRLVFAAVGAVAAVVSYGHIVNLFLKWHQTSLDAHLMPIAIDGLIIIGAGAAKSGQVWLGWSAIGPGLAASLYANVMNGLPHGKGAAMGSGWATIALFLATNVMERWKPAQAGRGGTGGSGRHEGATGDGDFLPLPESELATLDQPEPAVSQGGQGGSGVAGIGRDQADAEPLAEHQPAQSEPAEPPLAGCGHTVAGTPDENVIRSFLHERDCLRQAPSQRRLAATYGVSRPRVAQLVGSLNGQHPPDAGEPSPDH
jgi:hypothetical protein